MIRGYYNADSINADAFVAQRIAAEAASQSDH